MREESRGLSPISVPDFEPRPWQEGRVLQVDWVR